MTVMPMMTVCKLLTTIVFSLHADHKYTVAGLAVSAANKSVYECF